MRRLPTKKKAQLELEKRHKNVEQMQSVLSVVGSSGKVEIKESRKQEIKAWMDCKIESISKSTPQQQNRLNPHLSPEKLEASCQSTQTKSGLIARLDIKSQCISLLIT